MKRVVCSQCRFPASENQFGQFHGFPAISVTRLFFLWDGAQFYLFLGGEKRNNHSLAKKENTNHIFSGSKCVFDR